MSRLAPRELLLLYDGALSEVLALERDLARDGCHVLRLDAAMIATHGPEGTLPDDVLMYGLARGAGGSPPMRRAMERLRRLPGSDRVLLAIVSPGEGPTEGLHLVADDFVLQPASAAEIMLRLDAARLRRNQPPVASLIEAPTLKLDPDGFSVSVGGTPIKLTYTEFELLRALDERRGKVVPREGLARAVWGYDQLNGSRAVDVHMWRLRAKLEQGGSRLIETVRNRGYRLL